MNITSLGIGSGLDLEGIVEAYINAEAIPTEIRLQNKEDRLTTELSGVGQFRSALSNFESVVKKVADPEDFNKQLVEVSSSAISATTNGSASNGTFEIEVMQLAKGTRSESDLFTDSSQTVGSGTLTFTAGSETFDVAIEATDTLSDIRDKINAEGENFGVVVNVVNTDAGTFLSYSSEQTGAANELSITTSDASLDAISTNATIKQNAQDAIIEIDGNAISKETNVFQNVIEDVTITASQESVGSTTTLTISQDTENGEDIIRDFVNSYNALVDTLDALGNAETGALAFDPNIRSIKSQMTTVLTESVSSVTGSLESLNDIGVSLDRYGKLEISAVGIGTLPSGTEALADALANNLNEVGEVFASSDGVAEKLLTIIDDYNGTDGTLTLRNTSLSAELAGIPDEYEELESRLRDYEDTLRKKFTFLDQTVAQYNATGEWLTSTLAGLSGNSND